jgi:hypothetical protein
MDLFFHGGNYQQNVIKFESNGFNFEYKPQDNAIQEFKGQWDGKPAEMYGNKARWEFLNHLLEFEQKATKNNADIVKRLEEKYSEFNSYTHDLESMRYFFDSNPDFLYNMINGVDTVYFSGTMSKMGLLNDIHVTFASLQRGVAGATSILGDHTMIKINLLQFVSWFDNLTGSRKQSIGTENCRTLFECILMSFLHELAHALIIICSVIIKQDRVIVRPRHLNYKKWKSNPAPPTVGDLNYSGDTHNDETGHGSVFMVLLKTQFNQSVDYHDNYSVRQTTKVSGARPRGFELCLQT